MEMMTLSYKMVMQILVYREGEVEAEAYMNADLKMQMVVALVLKETPLHSCGLCLRQTFP
jgi:hypothetical protein